MNVWARLQQESHTVTFFGRADVTIGCPMDFSYFPFDQQTCVFEMGLLYQEKDISLSNLGAHLKNSEILDYKIQVKYEAFEVKIRIKKVSPWNTESTSNLVGFALEMKRRPFSIFFLYFLPSGGSQLLVLLTTKKVSNINHSFTRKVFLLVCRK